MITVGQEQVDQFDIKVHTGTQTYIQALIFIGPGVHSIHRTANKNTIIHYATDKMHIIYYRKMLNLHMYIYLTKMLHPTMAQQI